MDNEMKAPVRNAALAEAVAAVPGGALCDPQQVADAIRALMTEPQLADDIEREFGIAPAADVRDAERYRAWRDHLVAQDEAFADAMQEAIPDGVIQALRRPTADEWDAAIDAAMAAMADAEKGGA